jgi:DNA-binding transcriptional LysR family regulator
LTAAGAVFLVEARQILAHVERAAAVARSAVGAAATLRVGIIDSSYDSMPQILHEVQARYPGLVIHQVEASVPGQYQQLIDGRLDVGGGRAAAAPAQIASLLFRQDPLGVLVSAGHRFAGLEGVPVADLAEEPLLLAEEVRAPEFNQFTIEMCRSAGFTPTVPVVGPVARGRRLRPRTRRRQLCAGDVQAARLAQHRRRRPGGTMSNRIR